MVNSGRNCYVFVVNFISCIDYVIVGWYNIVVIVSVILIKFNVICCLGVGIDDVYYFIVGVGDGNFYVLYSLVVNYKII